MQYFIPSDSAPRLRILPNAFPALPSAVVRAAIELHSQPGDVIVDPFCIGTSVIEAALDLRRKVVAASFNPINILAIEHTLWPADARSAFTHLADARKGPQRLREHVIDLYTTRCPTCGHPSTALYFVWDREQNLPLEKHVRCESCGENVGPTDDIDLANAQRLIARGLPFWSLHGRVIDQQHDEAERVSEVIDAYTPRAQSALNDILSKFDALSAADQAALRPALLAMFDAATSLHTPDESRYPSGLKPPPRFVERNVWLELEKQVTYQSTGLRVYQRVPTIAELEMTSSPAACLLTAPARELVKQLPDKTVPLIVTHPLLPAPGFWSLNAAWAAWLWSKRAIDPLLPLLSRKRTNWDWQWRASGAALQALHPTLRGDAHCVMAFANDESVLESVTLAAASAGYVIDHLVCDPQDGVRVTWQTAVTPDHDTPDQLDLANDSFREITRHTAARILRDRAEPTSWLTLQAGILAALGQRDVLKSIAQMPEGDQLPLPYLRNSLNDALAGSAVFEIEPQVWWLKDQNIEDLSLSDRVERVVVGLLRSSAAWQMSDLLREVYRHFPDHFTPDQTLIATTIGSYVEDAGLERVRLRAEDQSPVREAEMNEVVRELIEVGKRLGFQARRQQQAAMDREPCVFWSSNGRITHTFVISTAATIEIMLRGNADVLVIPGGRATLLQHKLARDARLRETQRQVLKFSSLHSIAQQTDLSLETFHLAFGLAPPIEQPGTQIRLW